MSKFSAAIAAFNRHDNFADAVRAGVQAFNRYEAAIPVSSDRPYLPAFVRDARFDANSFTRWELTRKVRYFFRNTWLLPRLRSVDIRYTVGANGLTVIPASSDHEWGKRFQEHYLSWAESPFRDSSLSLEQGHKLMWGETHMDGEVFANLTSLKMLGKQSKPAIELIESHRCSSPGFEYDYPKESQDIIDGVQMGRDAKGDRVGRPSFYHIRDGDGETWKPLPAYDKDFPALGGVLHIYNPDRIGMSRAITPYAPILNQTADLELLAILEMDRAKQNAKDAAIFETWNGELPDSYKSANQNFLLGAGQPSIPGTEVDKALTARISQMQKALGSRLISIKQGEKMTYPENPSPSAAQQWLWILMISQTCANLEIPMVYVLPQSMQGTVTRAVLDDFAISSRSKFLMMARAAQRIRNYFAAWAIYNIPDLADPPADWMKCQVIPPRAPNVDVGRNSQAMLAEIAGGIRDYDDVAGGDGSSADVRFERKARNVGRIKQIAAQVSKEMGVDIMPAEIAADLADVLLSLAQAKGMNPDDATEEQLEEKVK
jgi:hypothetical protein